MDEVRGSHTDVAKKCLVTGFAGFIGSHLTDRLLEDGFTVVGVDNLSTGTIENVERLNKKHANLPGGRINFVRGELSNRDVIFEIFRVHPDIELVFHQAALGSIPRSLKNPQDTFESNVVAFNNVLGAAIANRSTVKRFIFASSSSIYGTVDGPCRSESIDPVGWQVNPYGASKYMNEVQALAYANAFGLEVIGLRYFNVFGPYQRADSQYAAVIAKWIRAVKLGEPLVIQGTGRQKRDFTYIDNVVEANILAANAGRDAANRCYNIGCGESVSLIDVQREITTHAAIRGIKTPWVEMVKARSGDIMDAFADISLAGTYLGYDPKVDWKRGIKNTCELLLSETELLAEP